MIVGRGWCSRALASEMENIVLGEVDLDQTIRGDGHA